MNMKQRIVIAVIAPIVCIAIGLGISSNVVGRYSSDPFNFQKTWWVWTVIVGAIGWLEYCLFADKKKDGDDAKETHE